MDFTQGLQESLTSGIPARDGIDKDSWGPWKEQAGTNGPHSAHYEHTQACRKCETQLASSGLSPST